MVVSMRDIMILKKEEYEQLPDDAFWEVVDGRAIPLPPPMYWHQEISDAIVRALYGKLAELRRGFVCSAVGIDIPLWPGTIGELQRRVPDIVICRRKPKGGYFEEGAPPEIAIEILSTRRGNTERGGKMDDYARASVAEYWIVNPIDRCVEVYLLREGDYILSDGQAQVLQPSAFPGLELDMREIWPILD